MTATPSFREDPERNLNWLRAARRFAAENDAYPDELEELDEAIAWAEALVAVLHEILAMQPEFKRNPDESAYPNLCTRMKNRVREALGYRRSAPERTETP